MFVQALKKNYRAKLFIIGIMSHLAFMFGFNASSLVLNEFFLIYVALFSLNKFGIILGFGDVGRNGILMENTLLNKISGGFLMLFALTAYYAWTVEIISSITAGIVPESITGMNLPVNVVQVFDMTFALPITIIGAVLLFRGYLKGLLISAVMSVFMLLVCISQLGMELALQFNQMPVDHGILYSMYDFTPLSIFSLLVLHRSASKLFLKQWLSLWMFKITKHWKVE